MTKAYGRFKQHYWRTEQILDAVTSGLENSRKPLERVFDKFKTVPTPKGRPPKNYKPVIKATNNNDGEGGVTFEIDDRSASLMKKVISWQLGQHKELDYHHFSILAVSIWGSYETYIYMLFEELFAKQPRMLKTKESITYNDAFDNRNNIEQYLAEKTLEKIGNFNLNDSLSYLEEKLNFKFTTRRENNLRNIYLIRNIIAHNSGILRPGQDKQLPKELSVKDRELRIPKTYLKRIHSTIKTSIDILEKHIDEKFFTRKQVK